jgi:hypothetical protein
MSAYQLSLVPPLASFERISEEELNRCLVAWEHKMGPLRRPMHKPDCYGLMHHGEIVGVIASSSLIPQELCGLTRENTIEVSRLCASRPGLCRVVLRLWRELVFPAMGYEYVISYQDEHLHTGATYRFDGWRVLTRTRSGTDQRSGRKGRSKTVWVWQKTDAT